MEIKYLKLNESQQQFINSYNQNILLSASAGSGKTYTMIKKLLNLILLEKVDVRHLLVVTFTKASASEMKQKLIIELQNLASYVQSLINNTESNVKLDYELIIDKTELNEVYEWIIYNLENINYSDIGDFHSIFKKIITKYFYELNIDPAFNILAESEQNITFEQAINNVFTKYIAENDFDFYICQETFNKKRKDTELRQVIKNLYNISQEKVNYLGWFNEILKTNFNDNLGENASANFLYNYYKNAINNQSNRIEKLLLEANMLKLNEKFISNILDLKHFINLVNETKNFKELSKFIFSFKFPDSNFGNKLTVEELELKEKVASQKEFIKKLINSIKDEFITYDEEQIIKATNETKNILLKLNEIVLKVTEEFSKIKANQSFVDFNDLQTLMLKLLENQKVQEELREYYKYIFIDEFQDVNEIQYNIIEKIAGLNNLHMIGDVKQSIYEFRLASPKIFLEIYKKYNLDNKVSKVINLNNNYRSSDHILQFVNFLFNHLITENTIGINYEKTASLISGNTSIQNFDLEYKQDKVKLTIVDGGLENNDEERSNSDENEVIDIKKDELEALQVVKAINDLLGKPYFNTDTNRVEFLDYKDIAVLTRDSGNFTKVLYDTFNNYKIPSNITNKGSIFKTNEVMVLFSLLKLLNNEIDDYSITTVLKSPLFNLTFNELSTIRLINNDKKVSYYNCIKQYIESENVNDNIKQKLIAFFEKINALRFKLTYTTLYQVMYELLLEHDLFNYYKTMPNGNNNVNNILEFLKLINVPSFDYDINFCVQHLTILKDSENFKINYSSGSNAVTVLTMHKSKGLEFPAVILAQLGKSFNKKYENELTLSNELGFGVKQKDIASKKEYATIQYNAAKLEKLSSELKEQIRLFYVATTRAKNYLYLIGSYSVKNIEKLLYKNVNSLNCFMEFVLHCFNESDIYKLKNHTSHFTINNDLKSKCQVELVTKQSVLLQNSEPLTINLNNVVDKNVIEKIISNINFKYDKKENVSIKNSVTSLLTESDYVQYNPTPKTLTSKDETGINNLSIQIGLAYHEIMQSINYNETHDELVNKITNGTNNISDITLKKYIDENKIITAVEKVKCLIKDNSILLKEKQFLLCDEHNKLIQSSNIDEKILVQGVVDLIIINGNNATIVDFKTNKNTTKQKLIDNYALQLNLYAHAVETGLKVMVSDKYLYSFDLNTLIRV